LLANQRKIRFVEITSKCKLLNALIALQNRPGPDAKFLNYSQNS